MRGLLLNQGHWPPIGVLCAIKGIGLQGGGSGGGSPQEEVTAATAAAATVSQELSPFGLALGVSRAGTKYPVR